MGVIQCGNFFLTGYSHDFPVTFNWDVTTVKTVLIEHFRIVHTGRCLGEPRSPWAATGAAISKG